MTIEDLLSRLDAVRRSSRGYHARCPAHDDRTPSLSVREGERGILVKCWAGCSVRKISGAVGLQIRDLFFDSDPQRCIEAAQYQKQRRQRRESHEKQQGSLIDALREADYFVKSRRGLDISMWSHDRLNDELNALADAYHLLESEALDG